MKRGPRIIAIRRSLPIQRTGGALRGLLTAAPLGRSPDLAHCRGGPPGGGEEAASEQRTRLDRD